MPYKSEKQRKYFHANRRRLEAKGVDVDEWDRKSRGKKLPLFSRLVKRRRQK